MDFKKHLENAWRLTLNNLSSLILLTMVLYVGFIVIPITLTVFSMPIVSFISLCVIGPILIPGYIYSILLIVREDRSPKLADLLSQRHLFLPLLIFSIIVSALMLTGFIFLILPGIAVLCAIAFSCLYIVPLMVDQNLGIIDAMKRSWQLAVKENVTDHWVIVILVIGLTTIGSSMILGVLFTQPFATVFVVSVYNEKISAVSNKTASSPESDQLNE